MILGIEIPKADRLPNERRSRKAPEDECHRPVFAVVGQSNALVASDVTKFEVRCQIADSGGRSVGFVPPGDGFFSGFESVRHCVGQFRFASLVGPHLIADPKTVIDDLSSPAVQERIDPYNLRRMLAPLLPLSLAPALPLGRGRAGWSGKMEHLMDAARESPVRVSLQYLECLDDILRFARLGLKVYQL